MVSALIILGTTGCVSVATQPTFPDCTIPQLEELPQIKREQLAPLDEYTYWDLQMREKRIVDWALEMQDMLKPICKGESIAPKRGMTTEDQNDPQINPPKQTN